MARIAVLWLSMALILAAGPVKAFPVAPPPPNQCLSSTSVPLPPGCPPGAACGCLANIKPACTPPRPLLDLYAVNGCTALGLPIRAARPRLNGTGVFQEFEKGEAAADHGWAGEMGSAAPDLVVAAYFSPTNPAGDVGDVIVQWRPIRPQTVHHHYLVTMAQDREAEKAGAVTTAVYSPASTPYFGAGAFKFTNQGRAAFKVWVRACDSPDDTVCADAPAVWARTDNLPLVATGSLMIFLTTPVSFTTIPIPFPATAIAPPEDGLGNLMDVPDPVELDLDRLWGHLQAQCANKLIDDKGELATDAALARLELLSQNLPCLKNPGDLKHELTLAIAQARVTTDPGTDMSPVASAILGGLVGLGLGLVLVLVLGTLVSPALAAVITLAGAGAGAVVGAWVHRHGDYDMSLIDLVRMATQYEAQLEPTARTELIDKLLTVRGEAKHRREYVYLLGLPTPVPETENHIWSTEVARYVTNEILRREYLRKGQPVPVEFDNELNGMDDWILPQLRTVLTEGFYENNARPYGRYTFSALSTLYDLAAVYREPCNLASSPPFAGPCDVRRGARNALDFTAAKFAVSADEMRRAAPYRRRQDFWDHRGLWGAGADPLTWRMYPYTGGWPLLADERQLRMSDGLDGMIIAVAISRYRPPVLVTDLIRGQGQDPYWQGLHSTRRGGDIPETYFRAPDYLITAGGRYDPGVGFVAQAADSVGWAIDQVGEPLGMAAAHIGSGEANWAAPTTLMPTRAGRDYDEFVRILGHADEHLRRNTCVTPGFACGLNPALPSGLPPQCQTRRGAWTFVNFNAKTPACPYDYGFFVAFHSTPCGADQACAKAAGPTDAERKGTFGFFEAVPAYGYDGIEDYIGKVLLLNGAWRYDFAKTNVYRSPLFGVTTFRLDSSMQEWEVVNYSDSAMTPTPARRFERWPLVWGSIMTTPRQACVYVDNPRLKERLILDHTRPMRPLRALVKLPSECRCPLTSSCLNPRAE